MEPSLPLLISEALISFYCRRAEIDKSPVRGGALREEPSLVCSSAACSEGFRASRSDYITSLKEGQSWSRKS